MELFEEDKIINRPNHSADFARNGFSSKQFSDDSMHFSGIETLSFQRDAMFALSSVLSSSISFHQHLLIVYTGDKSLEIQQICDKFQISYQYIKIENQLDEINALYNKQNFSHLVCCIDDNESFSSDEFIQLSLICHNSHTDLILFYNYVNSNVLEEYMAYQSAFSVFATGENGNHSKVLAKRNRLVQTEGISPSFDSDLYAHWQRSLSQRSSIRPILY